MYLGVVVLAKQLSSYPTRKNKSFILLLCWTTQLIQYVPIHNKNTVTSWQRFEMHIFNTDLLSATLQNRTLVLTARTVRFISAPVILTLWGRSTGINRDYFRGRSRVRDFRTSWWCIRNRTSERSERVRFLIQTTSVKIPYKPPAHKVIYLFHTYWVNISSFYLGKLLFI